MTDKITVPDGIDRDGIVCAFGRDAAAFYENRIDERIRAGKTYYNRYKTIYIWATQDRKTGQGFYSNFGNIVFRSRKSKNHGRT